MSYRLSADIGGTFTDIVLVNDETGEYRTGKVPTTPESLSEGVMRGFDEITGGDYSQVAEVVHGTTSGLNAIIERKGAKCALLTTKGFKDVYEIARGNRPEIYNNRYHRPQPLIPRKDIFEVDERVLADGKLEKEVTAESLKDILDKLKGRYESAAICFVNSYTNHENEKRAAEIIRKELGGEIIISSSYEVAREAREYERVSTTVLNAYIAPKMRHHLTTLDRALKDRGFQGNLYIMQSNGGVIRSDLAMTKAIQTLMSGPVGGAIGASAIDRENLIGFDIGGTSFDVSLVVGGRIETTVETEVEGFPALTPTVNVYSIGAGGGSIAWEEAGGMRVGPRSAGSVPGPVCYGRGGSEPTVTDANLMLGHLAAGYFLDGRIQLEVDKMKEALKRYGADFELDEYTTAEGILRIADNNMADAVREITVRRGIDPRIFTILAFGGAGPMHAASIADELDIKEVIVPPSAGVFSAWGMLQADLRHDTVCTYIRDVDEMKEEEFEGQFTGLKEELRELLLLEGIGTEKVNWLRTLDMRYYGQEYTISVEAPEGEPFRAQTLKDRFNENYGRLYGHSSPNDAVELVNLRLSAVVPVPKIQRSIREEEEWSVPAIDTLEGVFGGEKFNTAIYRRKDIPVGAQIHGPALIIELTTTTLVPPGWNLRCDKNGNLVMKKYERQV